MTEETQTNLFTKYGEYFDKQYDKTLKYCSRAFTRYHRGEKDIVEQQSQHTTERRCMDYDVCHNEMQSLHSQYNDTSRMDYGYSNYSYSRYLQPPLISSQNSANCVLTKFVHTSINKNKNSIFCIRWTPDGKRLLTGSSNGELTLWNASQFNFLCIQAPLTSAVRCMAYSHDGSHLLCGDEIQNNEGYCKIMCLNQALTPVNERNAHTERLREVCFSPPDTKFVSCGDDRLVKVWDFASQRIETEFSGSENPVYSVDWHPTQQHILSCSKGKIRLWDPRSKNLTYSFSPHSNEINKVRWNKNGNWFLSCSKDLKIKLFDIRMIRNPLMTYMRHNKDVTVVSWHNIQEDVFCSGSANGTICYWDTQHTSPIGEIPIAHDGAIWDLQWHPVGHMLASCSHDQTTKFWSRDRPNDTLETKKFQGTNREYDPIVAMYDEQMEQNYDADMYVPNEMIEEDINGFTSY